MKTKLIFSAAVACAVFFACKKDEQPEFTPTDVTGTTVVKGTVSKSVITPDGNGGWTNSSTTSAPAQGVNVSITVAKSSLYPNSNAQGADVYSATTDANGNFSVPVKSNANGVIANITIEGFTGTLDTVVNGQTRNGLPTAFEGTSMVRSLVMGQTQQINYRLNAQNVGSNPNTLATGTAVIYGSVNTRVIQEYLIGTSPNYSVGNAPPPAGHKVYLRLANDPITGSAKTYETTTDASGFYSFEVLTVSTGMTGFPQDADLWMNDYATTLDTLKANNTRVTGTAGVFKKTTRSEANLYSNTIRNAVYFGYNTFIAN